MSEKRQSIDMEEFAQKFANVYYVKLLFEKEVEIPYEELYKKLQDAFGEVDKVATSDLSSFALKAHTVDYQDVSGIPSQLMIAEMIPFDQSTIPDMVLHQCWTSENPQGLLNKCCYEIMVSDFLASGLERMERCQIIAKYIDVLLDVFPTCIALYWPHSQKLMPVEAYKNSQWYNPDFHFLDGGLNVRFFNVQDSEDMVVDTTGLFPLGIPDLQVHFHGIDHNFMIQYIYNFVSYLFVNGDIIKDGETMDGRNEHERWVCQHEDCLIAPSSVVLDVCPNEFAAGKRER